MSDQAAPTVVGVDGGSTKTIALVADSRGRILGAARGGGSSCTTAEISAPMQVVVDAVQGALIQAGRTGRDVAAGVFGLSGADWPEDHVRRQVLLAKAGLARQVIVKNDAFVGLRAGTRRRYGVVIAAGTSCNAAAVAPDGREWHFGYYQDYGGASTIGREAIRAVLHAEDGRGPPTALTAIVLGNLGCPTPEALLRAKAAGRLARSRVAGLSPLVFGAARLGDLEATRIIVQQGVALAEYATALIRRYDMQNLEFDVVLSGSVFKGEGLLLIDTITQAVHQIASRAHVCRQQFEPAVGGLLLAYDALGLEATDGVYDALARTAPDASFFSTDRANAWPSAGQQED
jgi:N-acetylglucosamine kinase-like BadF-type ATPase